MNVYDFDNTIYDGESVLDFFFYYIKKTPWLIKYIPKVFHALFRYKLGRITAEQALDSYGFLVEDYLSKIRDPVADAKDFWSGHEKNIKPFYKELHRDDDIIITASPEYSIKIICEKLDIKHCIGSVIDFENYKITRLCMRKFKVPAFLEAFPDAHIDNFYTDSEKNDAPLIEMADHAFIVKGNKIRQIK